MNPIIFDRIIAIAKRKQKREALRRLSRSFEHAHLCSLGEAKKQAPGRWKKEMEQASLLLVAWHAEAAALVARLGAVARQTTVPLVSVCEDAATGVNALTTGADFVLSCPPRLEDLQARLQAFYRRELPTAPAPTASGDGLGGKTPPAALPPESSPPIQRVGPLCLNRATRQCTANGEPLRLTEKEFRLLALLVDRKGACQSRAELRQEVWELDFNPSSNIVAVAICALRKKLRRCNLGDPIQTVRGSGYYLETEALPTTSVA